MRRVFAQMRKELTQIGRDRLALVLALVLPLCLLMLLGSAVSLTVTGLPVVVQDLDDTPASRDFIDAFRASLTFHIVAWPSGRQPADAFLTNTARAALVIPEHFGRDMARGTNTEVQLLVDATDANTAKLVQGYASQVVSNYRPAAAPVKADIRLWFNPGRDSKKFYAPGSFVMGLSMFPALLAALAMSKEGEQKTILQVYVSSISAHEFLLGKILAFALIAMAECAPVPHSAVYLLRTSFRRRPFGVHRGHDSLRVLRGRLRFAGRSGHSEPGGGDSGDRAGRFSADLSALRPDLSGCRTFRRACAGSRGWCGAGITSRSSAMPCCRAADGRPCGSSVVMIALIGGVFYALGWKKLRRMQLSI